jgi:hypothetical protein
MAAVAAVASARREARVPRSRTTGAAPAASCSSKRPFQGR